MARGGRHTTTTLEQMEMEMEMDVGEGEGGGGTGVGARGGMSRQAPIHVARPTAAHTEDESSPGVCIMCRRPAGRLLPRLVI